MQDTPTELLGYRGDEIVRLNPAQTYCFTVEDGRTYALTDEGKYQLKLRLYQIEKKLSDEFVKINQSCIVNIKIIVYFENLFAYPHFLHSCSAARRLENPS